MDICLKKKQYFDDESIECGSSTTAPAADPDLQNFVFEDFELTDSDREDYHNNVDILFVLDTTSSMGPYIKQSMMTIQKIIEKFSKMEFNIKFSLCTYRDHPPQDNTYVTQFTDLSSGKQIFEGLQKVSAYGGGDGPEAVMDGLREGLSCTSWRLSEDNITVSKRFLFHICDAPPHGQEYGGQSSDKNWQQHGCPCETKKEDINKLLKQHKVDYHLIKACKAVDKMEQLFRECFQENYAETIDLIKKKPQIQTNTLVDSKKAEEVEDGHSKKEKIVAEKESDEVNMWSGVVGALNKKLL